MSLRKVSAMSRLCKPYCQLSNMRLSILSKELQHEKSPNCLQKLKLHPMLMWRCFTNSTSNDQSFNVEDYPEDVEVSFEEFKYVERLLPQPTVPEVPKHSSYPTPSGWVPPNDEVRSKNPYLVRRTKNHVLPIYTKQEEKWKQQFHVVEIKKIEGDIWKLEVDLRKYLQEQTGEEKIITQVHEVSRCIRIRGQHRASVAEFLLERGM